MTILHLVEGLMVIAFTLYVFAYFNAIKGHSYHKKFAIAGFSIDMIGTYLMYSVIRKGEMFSGSILPDIHTMISLTAIVSFVILVSLGIAKKTNYHRKFSQVFFFPIWGVSFLTGFLMGQ